MTKKNKNLVFYVGVVVFVVALIGVVLVLFFAGDKETHISENTVYPDTGVLVCKTNAIDDAFFHDSNSQNESNTIKVLFTNDYPNKIFYDYSGMFDSEKTADYYNAIFHANYNEYFGDKALSKNRLAADFSTINNELRIELFGAVEDLTRALGVFYFIAEDEVKTFYKLDGSETKKFYEEKGFSCIISN